MSLMTTKPLTDRKLAKKLCEGCMRQLTLYGDILRVQEDQIWMWNWGCFCYMACAVIVCISFEWLLTMHLEFV